MLGGVLDLRELHVSDIMVHRTKMEMVNADETPQKIVDELLRSQYTRVPIWKDQPENIVGVLHTKDLLSALGRAGWDVAQLEIMSFAAEPWFVPDTSLQDQLNEFLKRKAQMALVVDEYGEVQGLITLEDILEEIVGQITDEHDTLETGIRPNPDGSVNVDGAVPVRDLNRCMDWSLPDEEATTVAGLVIHEAQTIPERGRRSRSTAAGSRSCARAATRSPRSASSPSTPRAAGQGAALPIRKCTEPRLRRAARASSYLAGTFTGGVICFTGAVCCGS